MPKEFEIARQVVLAASPEQVWQTIATEAGLAAWFMPSPVDPSSDVVVGWEPGRRLAIRTPEAPDGSLHAFEYLIEARHGGSTVLRFVHSGVLGDDWSDEYEHLTAGGWEMYLYTLAQYHAHFPGRPAIYVEAEGPPSSSSPAAWPALVGALGAGAPVELDAPVRVSLRGTAPLEGIVDYSAANFVGLRTRDALIRFHGRAGLGMTVAVSHHAYSDVDAGQTRQAWVAWLAEAFSGVGAGRS
jgi:uncharacterized protein YndB with AHSA1/START domain